VSSVRVIAGVYGGRVLKAPRGSVTRPTSSRVREALFAILGDLTQASVLDLYAGTGALAVEALSRGAARAVLVEHDRGALDCIRDNVATLGLEARVKVIPQRLPRAVASVLTHGPFDLVLCDPPWADRESACGALARLVEGGGIGASARVVLEHAGKDKDPLVAGLVATDHRAWGDTAVTLFRTA
jgi:16S rRNA (guanine966-N2)-methyltransferase